VQSRAASRSCDQLDVAGGVAGRAYSSLFVRISNNESKVERVPCSLTAMAILETSRLILRPFREEDLDPLAQLMANPDFMRFSLGVLSREQTAEFLQKLLGWNRAGLPSQFAVIFRPTGELLGYCGFYHHHVDGTDEIEIGYRLHPHFWNQGLATEGARAVRDHAFRDLNLTRVISLVHPENAPSRRVAEKNGMIQEKETIFRGLPTFVFAISRQQWSASCGA
jgi:RimJ/RimL family protein N-acetyltransferase